ncbi:hypothetical protein RE474_10235 [Methanolobus sediminis]|uniref:Uncharacterized protein n=1 Tax=Methanolobus sediminis TaxID=3072978 RepID=A0AA51YL13_9EURY|nr:hypothetical protein [Methanolobus sediminis]WMW24462.1 hypothetical protein RE474_10235 [Methanolobus sediminis]
METCMICGELQDFKHFEGYNICTTCADIMEDIMGEYFLSTIWKREPKAHAAYLNYLNNTTKYISDYKKLAQKSGQHTRDVSAKVHDALENGNSHPSKKRYFEHMQKVLDWLEATPHFYHYYFKDYYVCPECGASIFDKYTRRDVGDWMVISCSECDTVIKKYFSFKSV